MKIILTTDKLLAELEQYKLEVQRKLTGMVQKFAYSFAVAAIHNTPVGNSEQYAGLYNLRSRLNAGFTPVAGHAKAGWWMTMNYQKIGGARAEADPTGTVTAGRMQEQSKGFKLGDTVYLTNITPYVATPGWSNPMFGSLEQGYSRQAPQGIALPTIADIETIYRQDLVRFYNES